MLLNEHTALVTPQILLCPYSEHHVPAYHEWMKDEVSLHHYTCTFYSPCTLFLLSSYPVNPHAPSLSTPKTQDGKEINTNKITKKELQELTASEPLSLPEEYDMQRSWRQDPDKLTFIACLPPSAIPTTITPKQDDAPSLMLGDINLFLNDDDEEDEDEDATSATTTKSILGEIELMIAVKSQHRKGHGRASLLAFLHYVLSNTSAILNECSKDKQAHLRYLRVKINAENFKSIALFESVGFVRTSAEANYFGELELRLQVLGNENVLGDLEKVKGWIGKPSVVEYREV
ncbi:hypothetical protein E4T50_14252 [Aureobasidium sp. EXF-12298]|nr:hypothetical protein E4T50_14252 [Aureobasidium sp. EXF-12298]KAI4753085.1 hypothetical protein E4T51_13775 [Aureobasidium sp. EXF-12344]KAI4770185.1 hypothetical protein E4T52_14783 [Aureobasidium sp. EXF-3400]